MNQDAAVLTLFVLGVSLTANVALVLAWIHGSRRLRRLEDRLLGTSTPAPQEPRTERLEQAVDALASQMDQLASGQEFLNRVIADRLDRLQPPRPRQEPVTPH